MLKKYIYKFLDTDGKDYSLLVLRVTLGVFMGFHGFQKLLGWFGGYGFEGSMGYLSSVGIPTVIAFLVIIGESLGGIALILGYKVRFMALATLMILLGAVFIVHISEGFTGYEKHLLGIAMSIAIMIKGAGAWSIDHYLKRYFTSK